MADAPHQDSNHPVAIITGASIGLGRALARALAERGWALVIDARRSDLLDTAVDELSSGTTVAVICPGDVTDDAHRAALVEAAAQDGPVSLVVNNASTLGASPHAIIERPDIRVLRRIFEVNVVPRSPWCGSWFPTSLRARPSSTSRPTPRSRPTNGAAYGASKAALDQAGRVLAAERPDSVCSSSIR